MIKNLQDRFVVLIRMSRAYSQKISVIGVDPASIPGEQFSLKCLPPVEVSCSFLRPASTPKKQLKAFKSLEAFSQMVSGFITSVSRQSNRRQVCRESKCSAFTTYE